MFPNGFRRRTATPSGSAHGRDAPTVPLGGAHDRRLSGPVRRRSPPQVDGKRAALADALTRALAARRYSTAMGHILSLIELEPAEPRWQQKYGEVLRTLGRNREAAAAYRRAARRYEAQGLPARASAALRVADSLDGADSAARAQQASSDRVRTQRVLLPDERITSRPPSE